MSVVKPLLWLLEPYIVYKAYLWGLHFYSHPLTWEGEVDWFSLTLTLLLAIDAVVLPLLLLYLPACNPHKEVPKWIMRMFNPLDRFVAWIEGKQLGTVWMMNRPLNVRPKILTLRRSVFLWQNIALYLN